MFRRGCWLPLAGVVAGFWTWILGSGYDGGPAGGPGCRGSTAPGFPSLLGGTGSCWSGGGGDGLDALPGGDDRICPGPGPGDLQEPAPPAADEAGGGVQDAVAQRLRPRPGQVAVQGDELQPGQQDAGDHGRVEPRLVDLVVVRGEVAEPGVLAGADAVLVVGGGGEWPGPVSLPVRMTSSTRAWTRCAASM